MALEPWGDALLMECVQTRQMDQVVTGAILRLTDDASVTAHKETAAEQTHASEWVQT